MKGSIHRLKNGRWEGQIELPRCHDGKRRRKYVYADTRRECDRLVYLWIRKIEGDSLYEAKLSDLKKGSMVKAGSGI